MTRENKLDREIENMWVKTKKLKEAPQVLRRTLARDLREERKRNKELKVQVQEGQKELQA